ncbi:cysteine proteinase [Atractiella rhizophila]|nr:cysteine proteinase [Atractiella rhizophila]
MSAWSVAAASYSLSPITTLQFDFLQELLWSGNSQGYVSSWFTTDDSTSSTLNRYTSYKAHNLSQTHQILSNDRGILSLGMDSVKLANRRGLCQWQYQERNIALSNMAHSPIKNSEVVVAASSTNSLLSSSLAHRHELLLLNVATGTLLKRTGITSPTSHIRTSKNLLCCAQLDGTIVLREPREYRISRTLPAHTGGISALEVGENTLYSLGYTIRQGVPIIDPHVKIYDIRAMKALAPVPTSISPSFLKVHPKKSNNIYLAATDGRWKYIDVDNQGDFEFNHLEAMGFPTLRCQKALLATGNADPNAAMEWLFAHMDDAGSEIFCSFQVCYNVDEQTSMSPIKSATSGKRSDEPSEEQVGMISEMGFTLAQARKALRETGGNAERAIEWLFAHPDDSGEEDMTVDRLPEGSSSVIAGSAILPANYRLKAFISHKGPSVHSGHYVAHIWEGEETGWVLFNDEKVVRAEGGAQSAKDLAPFAYVYVYERI